MRIIYSILLYVAAPVIFLRLWWKGRNLLAYRLRWRERLAFFSVFPANPRIWLHAVSVGEVIAASPLIERLIAESDKKILVTTTTPTGSRIVNERFSERVEHVYFPYDFPDVVKRFLRKTKPSVLIVIETELWPNCFHYCEENNIPVIIVNARLAEKSFSGYKKLPSLTKNTLQSVVKIFAQGKKDADRLVSLGANAENVEVVGNLKFDIELPESQAQQGAKLREKWPPFEFVWIATSTHEGEEALVIKAHKALQQLHKSSLLILAPRHPDRFQEVTEICKNSGLNTKIRSLKEKVEPDTKIYLADTLGELDLLYGAVDVALVAGSFSNIGGHNPLEPAVQSVPVITGPVYHNFSEIYSEMFAENAAIEVKTDGQLVSVLDNLASNLDVRTRQGQSAYHFVADRQGGLEMVAKYILATLSGNNL